MSYPTNYRYTKDHEWAKADGNVITVGITDHAQSALGDVVFVELPKIGRELKFHETFGVVESIKAVSDLYSPVAGKVVEVNSKLIDDPAALNRDAHGSAWLMKIEVASPAVLQELLDAAAYQALIATLK